MRQVELLALGGEAAAGGVLEGEVRGRGEDALGLGVRGELAHPPARALHERARRHDRGERAGHRRENHTQQAHVVEEREPGDALGAIAEAEAEHQLQHVGAHAGVRDLDTGRGAGGTRGVLQVRNIGAVQVRLLPRAAELAGDRVDGDHTRPLAGRDLAEQLTHSGGRLRRGEDDGGLTVPQNRVQAILVARLVGIEQRDGDESGVNRGEERDDVVEPLGREDRDAIARRGHLLEPRRDGVQTRAEARPRQVLLLPLARLGVVVETEDESIRGGICIGSRYVLLHEVHQRGVLG